MHVHFHVSESWHEQANAVSDKLLDLRNCNFEGKNLSGKVLAGALLSGSNLAGANMIETVLSKVLPP